jgi:pyrimidine-specific ribonucleoside hydrolase
MDAPRIPLAWDMETSDPDDFMTLLLLLGHPRVDLRSVTVTPGTPAQVGVVRWALRRLGREDVPVGAHDLRHPKPCVSQWHYDAFGEIPPSDAAEPGDELLLRVLGPDVTLVTGAPLKNLGAALRRADAAGRGLALGRLVIQGGFAGEGVVPPALQLEKFRGRVTCPSFNLGGDPRSALLALAHPGVAERRLVAKNVCHGVVYDAALHARVGEVAARSPALALIHAGMDHYFVKHPAGKIFHDPLAACCAIDPTIATWAEVEVYRARGEWGARLAAGTRTHIIVDLDRARFVDTLLAT